jgi:hypothetical protein
MGKTKHKATRAQLRKARAEARKLLRSPRFFNEFLLALQKKGLVGEERNALALLIVVVSRLLPRPLNIFVKGKSSSGKNWLVTRVLRLMPKDSVVEITSASERAWNYSRSDFQHRVIYIQEMNKAAGSVHPIRLLISEGKLIRLVSTWKHRKLITEKQVAEGPVASISTTTQNRLEIDDESRHISIWVDESRGQTRRIVKSYTKQRKGLSRRELRAWRMVHSLLESRIGIRVMFPGWFDEIADRLFVNDLSVRRYYPAFVEACRTICLIRSFQSLRKLAPHDCLEIEFADFAITSIIFDPVFVESLHRQKGTEEIIGRAVRSISVKKKRPVTAKDIARKLGISMDGAYASLRRAEEAGVIKQANKPEKSNRKRFLPTVPPHFVPDPEKLFQELKDLTETVRFIHPISGECVVYRREK